jgi:serine O-acetyltransferase
MYKKPDCGGECPVLMARIIAEEGRMRDLISDRIHIVIDDMVQDVGKGRAIDKLDVSSQPDSDSVIGIIEKLERLVFPGYHIDRVYKTYSIRTMISIIAEDVAYHLDEQIARALRFDQEYADIEEDALREKSQMITLDFLGKIPKIREYLDTDIEALFDGDPAAESKEEVIISYPGLYAISVHRFAHELYLLRVPILPRIMSEHAHSVTGIDINPGAVIGKYFFIDHGTGIVVGETTEIGEHVKLYQGVTLGALSTRGGRKLNGRKRHPTIQDNVTIYSGASILGGDTVIGSNSVIGGNVFLTHSVPPGTRVNVRNQELKMRTDTDEED